LALQTGNDEEDVTQLKLTELLLDRRQYIGGGVNSIITRVPLLIISETDMERYADRVHFKSCKLVKYFAAY